MLSYKYLFRCTLLVLLFTGFGVILGHHRLKITAPVTMSVSVNNFQFDYLYFDGFRK